MCIFFIISENLLQRNHSTLTRPLQLFLINFCDMLITYLRNVSENNYAHIVAIAEKEITRGKTAKRETHFKG